VYDKQVYFLPISLICRWFGYCHRCYAAHTRLIIYVLWGSSLSAGIIRFSWVTLAAFKRSAHAIQLPSDNWRRADPIREVRLGTRHIATCACEIEEDICGLLRAK